jgi:hypothetical protein
VEQTFQSKIIMNAIQEAILIKALDARRMTGDLVSDKRQLH